MFLSPYSSEVCNSVPLLVPSSFPLIFYFIFAETETFWRGIQKGDSIHPKANWVQPSGSKLVSDDVQKRDWKQDPKGDAYWVIQTYTCCAILCYSTCGLK